MKKIFFGQVVIGTLRAYGVDVVDVGIVPTPTVQYITMQEASGGIYARANKQMV